MAKSTACELSTRRCASRCRWRATAWPSRPRARSTSGPESALLGIESLAEQLRENLAKPKNRTVEESELLVAGIYGTWQRFSEPFPRCSSDAPSEELPEVPVVCPSERGDVFSGDRYERFTRQFVNHYPREVVTQNGPGARLDFSQTEPLGWMCADTFGPPLQAIGSFEPYPPESCIAESLLRCGDEGACPDRLFNGAGQCQEVREEGLESLRFCDSGLTLWATRDREREANFPLEENPYCIRDSVGWFGPGTCVIDYSLYQWQHCRTGRRGVRFEWNERRGALTALTGHDLEVVYTVDVER